MTTAATRRHNLACPHDERRSCPRRPAVESRASLAWEAGPPPFRHVSARLIDISEQGAQIAVDAVPCDVGRVWVRLDAVPWEWVRATVRAMRGVSPCCHVHLSFPEPCPPGVLEEAVDPTPSSCDDSTLRLNLTFDFERD
jgi:PilZ domain